MVVKELFARLGLDVEESGFQKADSLFGAIDKALIGLGIAVGAAAAGLAVLVRQTANAGDNAKVAAARLGITTDAVQELGYAAEQSDTSIEALQQAFTFLGKKGVKDVDAEFARIAATFASMPNDGARLKFAFDALGKAGKDLAPLLAEGADGLASLRAEARSMGLVLDKDAVEAGDRFNDTLGRIEKRLEGLRNRVIGPWLSKFERGLARVEKVVETLSDALAESVKWLDLVAVVLVSTLAAALVVAADAYGALALAALAASGPMITAALAAASAWMAAVAPVLTLAALFALLVIAVDEVYGFLTGADSLIGELGEKWVAFLDDWMTQPGEGWLENAVKAVIVSVSDLGAAIPNALKFWKEAFVGFFSWVGDRFGVLVAKLAELLEKPLGALRRTFGGAPTPAGPDGVSPTVGLDSFGGGASPAASVGASPSRGVTVAPSFVGTFNVTAAPGQDPNEVAGLVRDTLDSWHNAKMRETLAAVGA